MQQKCCICLCERKNFVHLKKKVLLHVRYIDNSVKKFVIQSYLNIYNIYFKLIIYERSVVQFIKHRIIKQHIKVCLKCAE